MWNFLLKVAEPKVAHSKSSNIQVFTIFVFYVNSLSGCCGVLIILKSNCIFKYFVVWYKTSFSISCGSNNVILLQLQIQNYKNTPRATNKEAFKASWKLLLYLILKLLTYLSQLRNIFLIIMSLS